MAAHGIFRPPAPVNEPVRDYAPGSPERAELQQRLAEMQAERLDVPCVIGAEEVRTGDTVQAGQVRQGEIGRRLVLAFGLDELVRTFGHGRRLRPAERSRVLPA